MRSSKQKREEGFVERHFVQWADIDKVTIECGIYSDSGRFDGRVRELMRKEGAPAWVLDGRYPVQDTEHGLLVERPLRDAR